MKEQSNINTTTEQSIPTATVYGIPAYINTTAALGMTKPTLEEVSP